MKKILWIFLSLWLSTSFAAAPQQQKLTVILDWFPNPDHAPLIVAKQQGFFKEQGLEVELIGPTDPTDAPKWIAARKADIGVTYQPGYIEQVDHHLPLIHIGTLIDKPLNSLVALKGDGIKTLADLKGKRIGTSTGGLTALMLKTMLKQAGLSIKDVEIVNTKYNLTQALLSRKIDAATGMMRNFEVPQLELNGRQVVAFFPEEHGVPNYYELIFIANTADAHDNRYPRFMAAIKKAVRYMDEHPQESWNSFAKEYPAENNQASREAWFITLPYFAEDPVYFQDHEWKRIVAFMHKNHLINTIQPMSRYTVTAA